MDTQKPKVIGINALFLIPNEVGGTEYHLRSFIKHLQLQDTYNQYIIFCNRENYETFECTGKNWKKVLCPITARNRVLRIAYEQVLFPQLVQKNSCTLLHSYGYFGPITGAFKKVVTVHDCNWLDHPDDTPALQNFILHQLISRSLKSADKVVTDSEFSLSRLVHYFPQYSTKFVVIQPGIDDLFLKLLAEKTVSPVSEKYILCVSALYPHKKMLYLLDLWKEFSRHSTLHLVIVGQHGADEAQFLQKLPELERVHHYTKVDYKTLVALYKHAELFIFPSVYEGFGFPVYEAYAAGVLTIVGNADLYAKNIQSEFIKLSFSINSDSQLIQKESQNLSKKRKSNSSKLFLYQESVIELIELYSSL